MKSTKRSCIPNFAIKSYIQTTITRGTSYMADVVAQSLDVITHVIERQHIDED